LRAHGARAAGHGAAGGGVCAWRGGGDSGRAVPAWGGGEGGCGGCSAQRLRHPSRACRCRTRKSPIPSERNAIGYAVAICSEHCSPDRAPPQASLFNPCLNTSSSGPAAPHSKTPTHVIESSIACYGKAEFV